MGRRALGLARRLEGAQQDGEVLPAAGWAGHLLIPPDEFLEVVAAGAAGEIAERHGDDSSVPTPLAPGRLALPVVALGLVDPVDLFDEIELLEALIPVPAHGRGLGLLGSRPQEQPAHQQGQT